MQHEAQCRGNELSAETGTPPAHEAAGGSGSGVFCSQPASSRGRGFACPRANGLSCRCRGRGIGVLFVIIIIFFVRNQARDLGCGFELRPCACLGSCFELWRGKFAGGSQAGGARLC